MMIKSMMVKIGKFKEEREHRSRSSYESKKAHLHTLTFFTLLSIASPAVSLSLSLLRPFIPPCSDHIYGYALGCDLTKRDLQQQAKDKRVSWCTSKGFDLSAPCGAITEASELKNDPMALDLSLAVNGEGEFQSQLLSSSFYSIFNESLILLHETSTAFILPSLLVII
jgi:hypothetical protein